MIPGVKLMTDTLLAAFILSASLSAGAAIADTSAPPTKKKSDVLQRIDMLDTRYQMGLQKAVLAPNEVKARHMHTGPEVAYVLDGEIIITTDGQPEEQIRAGESFQHEAYAPHITTAGPQGATVLATWVVEKGKSFAVPAP